MRVHDDYAVDRWRDFGPYMVDAQMTVNKDDAFIGSAHYHLAGHGGFSLMKWEGTHSKIDSVLDEMLRHYPKVDIGMQRRRRRINRECSPYGSAALKNIAHIQENDD